MEKQEGIKKHREDGVCLGAALSLSLPPFWCINIHVRYVNDLYMYAKLSPTICFHCLCCHDSSKKTSAFFFSPRLPSTSVLADAAVSVSVYV